MPTALRTPRSELRIGWLFTLGLLSVLLGGALPGRAEIVLSDYGPRRPLKIMAIGDSITDDCSYNGAWRQYLQPLLETNGYSFNFMGRQSSVRTGQFTKTLHEGYCGAVIAPPGMMTIGVHGYAGTNVYLLKTIADTLTNVGLRSDLVLVVMGANDIGRGRDPYHVATNDMPQLLDLLFSNSPNANIILTKTTTLSNAVLGYMTNASNVPVYNSALQEMVKGRQALGQKVFLADMFSAVDYSTMFNDDHLHPNPQGLTAMAKEFLTRILAITVRSNGVTTTTLIPGGAEWRYSATGQDLGTAWTRNDYDDSAWSRGAARVGYGDPAAVTSLGFDPANKPLTFYFRRSFVVPDNVAFTNLDFRLARSDGAVVWLNGQEAFRTNMPAGLITFTNLASSRVSGEAAYIFYPTNLAVAPLPPGTNVVAVEIHASAPSNPSMGFDLELLGTGYVVPPPALSAALTDSGLSLQWPATNRMPYALFWTDNLSAPSGWFPVSTPVQTNNDQCAVTMPLESTPRFFRLQKQ